VVKLLLKDRRVDPTFDNNYPIRIASCYGHYHVVKLLLKKGEVNPADMNNYALRMAGNDGHLEVVKLLLSDPRVKPAKGVKGNKVKNGEHQEVLRILNAFIALDKLKKPQLKELIKKDNIVGFSKGWVINSSALKGIKPHLVNNIKAIHPEVLMRIMKRRYNIQFNNRLANHKEEKNENKLCFNELQLLK